MRSASTKAVDAARYPTRAPARENALLMVRLTARLPYRGSSSRALGVPVRRNSPYASSTTTTAFPAASRTASTVASGSAVPVGLFGLVSRTTDGRCRRICSRAWSRSIVKSVSRWPVTHVVRVSRAYSGYIEYVGAKLSAVRPGPPKACSTCSITSLDPLAAQTCSGARSAPDSVRRKAARSARRSRNSRSGYRFSPAAACATAAAMSATICGATG